MNSFHELCKQKVEAATDGQLKSLKPQGYGAFLELYVEGRMVGEVTYWIKREMNKRGIYK